MSAVIMGEHPLPNNDHEIVPFVQALARFDAANARDTNGDRSADGTCEPRELLYAQRMSLWLTRFAPDASEALRLAVRCQHIRRWMIPRSDYPEGRAGYHAWRQALQRYHAETAAAILRDVGYDEAVVIRVQTLLLKQDLSTDSETQCLEDVVCLNFLAHYAVDFVRDKERRKVLDILRKSWAKMSPRGRQFALSVDLPAATRNLLEQALEPET